MPDQRFTPDTKLADWLGFHPANTRAKQRAHEDVRACFYALSCEMNALLPEGPDKTVALRAIRDAAMQCNAALAVNGGPDPTYDIDSPAFGYVLTGVLDVPRHHLASELDRA